LIAENRRPSKNWYLKVLQNKGGPRGMMKGVVGKGHAMEASGVWVRFLGCRAGDLRYQSPGGELAKKKQDPI